MHKYVQAFTLQVERLLEGSIVGDPDAYGQTLKEEKDACGMIIFIVIINMCQVINYINRYSRVAGFHEVQVRDSKHEVQALWRSTV